MIKKEIGNSIEDDIKQYSKTTFKRNLPCVLDGLKIVMRRLLYTMFLNKNYDLTKSITIVGNTLSLHPHGDNSVYQTLINMSKDWGSIAYPYVDIQGNGGTLTGDTHAASRYTEIKVSQFARDVILDELDNHSIPYMQNELKTGVEPRYLPSKIPLLLLQGSSGISEGFISYFPSHNLSDVCDITIKYIKNQSISLSELVKDLYPDFTTGGNLLNPKDITSFYSNNDNNLSTNIVVESDSFDVDMENFTITVKGMPPFGTTFNQIKDNIIRKRNMSNNIAYKYIIDIITNSKDYKNYELDTHIICAKNNTYMNEISKILKPQFVASKMLKFYCEKDSNVISVSLKDVLYHWLNVQRSVKINKLSHSIANSNNTLHILEGLYRCYDLIDDIIELCKKSKNNRLLIEKLKNKPYNFTEIQANGIISMQLSQLSRISKEDLFNRITKLKNYIKKCEYDMLNIDDLIINDINFIKNKYARKRRTKIIMNNKDSKSSLFQNNGIGIINYDKFRVFSTPSLLDNSANLLKGASIFIDKKDKTKYPKIITNSFKWDSEIKKLLIVYEDCFEIINTKSLSDVMWNPCEPNKIVLNIFPIYENNNNKLFVMNKDGKCKILLLNDINSISFTKKKVLKLSNKIKMCIQLDKKSNHIIIVDNEGIGKIIPLSDFLEYDNKNNMGVILNMDKMNQDNLFLLDIDINNPYFGIFYQNEEKKDYLRIINKESNTLFASKRINSNKKILSNNFLSIISLVKIDYNTKSDFIGLTDTKSVYISSKYLLKFFNKGDIKPFKQSLKDIFTL